MLRWQLPSTIRAEDHEEDWGGIVTPTTLTFPLPGWGREGG